MAGYGFQGGNGGYPPPVDAAAQLRAEIRALQEDFNKKFANLGGHLRRRDDILDTASRRLGEISAAVDVLKSTRVGIDEAPGLVRIENIPGRRVPFTYLVDIPIGSNTTSIQQASLTISQEGPFVAVKRMATFQSAYEFQVNTIDQVISSPARYAGRSFGRFRPVHSAWDLLDGQVQQPYIDRQGLLTSSATPEPLFESDGIVSYTRSHSSFRTMEFDGRIAVINAGSSYPRQNIPVPSSFWSTSINAPMELGALDFFERGEVITFQVSPTHVNNPPAGNADGPNILGGQLLGAGAVGWPFLQGQYDPQEGIVTPAAWDYNSETETTGTELSDPIVRLPDGILTLGYEGYRIIQPVAP
jgi:hypothetical protein